MKVQKLSVKNFRNIQDTVFYPDSRVNFLVGDNGQGKTSLIEALGFVSTLRSFRDSKVGTLLRHGSDRAEVRCELRAGEDSSEADWKTGLRVTFDSSSKSAFINEKPYRSSTQYLSQRFGSYELGLHAVVFNPSDHDLVRGDPSTRRSYLDKVLMAESIEYLKAVQKYQRILLQRNAVLKNQDALSRDVLIGFTEPLCQMGAALTLKRLEWIQRLSLVLDSSMRRIAPESPELRAVYLSNWVPCIENLSYNNKELDQLHFTGQGQLPSLELLEQSFWKRVSELEAAERRAGHSLIGPHRDDWTFFLDDQVLKGRGSQGEVRSALVALKLCEIELFRSATGHRPLFLLDDFSSELDQERRSFLIRFLAETDLQTFVTTTEGSSLIGKRFWVQNGMVREGTHDNRSKARFE